MAGNLTTLGNSMANLCQGIRATIFPFGVLEIIVFIAFAIVAYYSYGKYGKSRNLIWLAAAVVSALVSVFSLIGALIVFISPSLVSALYGAPANC